MCIAVYSHWVFTVRKTERFLRWLKGLRDRTAVVRIAVRIDRLESGQVGDAKSVGDSVAELRIDHGPGYRLYFTRRGDRIIILLCGGDKSTQSQDIATARQLAKDLQDEP
jgi:putative addiction module killer protein